MQINNIVLMFSIFWIISFFIALPIKITMPNKVELGHADSAPEKHYLKQKLYITFCISILLTAIFFYFVF